MTLVSIVTPCYNEAENLPHLFERLKEAFAPLAVEWEWVVIDDHSRDETFAVARRLAEQHGRVRATRLARNFGSHLATMCGLHRARGDCAIVMGADLQDPPETIPQLLDKWKEGAQVVWAVRRKRPGEKRSALLFARLYYWIMRNVAGLRDIPPEGADFFLLDRRVLSAYRQYRETHTSVLVLLTWMGFRQAAIQYDKQPRAAGRSGWTLEKKLKLVLDSITSFTYFPIRFMSYVGIVTALTGGAYAFSVVRSALSGYPPEGWASLMVVVLIMGGLQMVMLGTLGEYLWRALDEARRRPPYLVEDETDGSGGGVEGPVSAEDPISEEAAASVSAEEAGRQVP